MYICMYKYIYIYIFITLFVLRISPKPYCNNFWQAERLDWAAGRSLMGVSEIGGYLLGVLIRV